MTDVNSGVSIHSQSRVSVRSSDTKKAFQHVSCWGRFVGELRRPMFGVMEVDGTEIDVQASFAPKPTWRTVFIKFVLLAWTLSIVVTDLQEYGSVYAKYYLIYLTNWCHVSTILYIAVSLMISVCPGMAQQPVSSNDARPNFLLRMNWGLFSVVATIQMSVALLFWMLEYDVDNGVIPAYSSLMKHGIFMVLVLAEGLILNATPIRARQLFLSMTFTSLYFIWSLLHSFLGVGNPLRQDNNDTTDDDAIYEAINWKKRPESTAMIAAITALLIVPVLFLMLWMWSAYSNSCCFCIAAPRRRYLERSSDANQYNQMIAA